MASSDNAILYGLRETTFGTPATVVSTTISAVSDSTGNLSWTMGASAPGFVAGQMVSISGFAGADALYDGVYEVVSETTTTLVTKCPAGKYGQGGATGASATVGNHIPVRYSGSDTLALTPARSESDEITGNRGVEDLQEDGRSAGGGFSGPFTLPWLDAYIQMLSGSAWDYAGANARVMATGTDHEVVSTNIIRLASGTWSNVVVGDMVKIYGGTNNGKMGIVSANSGTDLTLTHVSLTNHGTEDETVVIVADTLIDGSTIYKETLERRYNDITGGSANYPQFPGSVLDSISMTAGAQAAPAYQMTWQCADETSPTPTSSMGTVAPKVVGKRINGARVEVWIDAATGGCVQSLTVNYANNLDPRVCLGSTAITGMDMRALSVGGSLERRYETATQYNKFLALTDATLLIKFKAAEGPALCLWLEKVNYSAASRGASARNSNLIGSLDFTALELPAGYTAKWFRWAR